MLVAQECGRVLAGAPLLGLLPASALLRRRRGDASLEAVAAGELRAAWLPARPPERPRRGLDGRPAQRQGTAPRAARDASTATA